MSVKIQKLTKFYDNKQVLNHISLEIIEKNNIIGLLGPNGAGKTTMMRSICGSLNYNSGTILINDINNKKYPEKTKKIIGYLPENNPLYQEMFIKDYLSFVADIHQIDKKKINELIDRVGLKNEQNKKIKQLSKGYKQRVGLAQAIIHDPEILILDEPTNGLDPNQIIEIRDLIKNLKKNKIIILSTHIMQEVESMCDRVILLNKGNIIQDCMIDEFKSKFDTLEEAFFNYTHEN